MGLSGEVIGVDRVENSCIFGIRREGSGRAKYGIYVCLGLLFAYMRGVALEALISRLKRQSLGVFLSGRPSV